MERRNFILSGLGGMAVIPLETSHYKSILKWDNFFREEFPLCGINPQNTRLILKPIMTNLIHSDVWEGPCRNNVVTVEEETQRVKDSFNSWKNNLNNQKSRFDPGHVILMEPSLVIFKEDFTIYPDQFEKIEPDALKADAFLISPEGASITTFKIAEKYNKPIISDW